MCTPTKHDYLICEVSYTGGVVDCLVVNAFSLDEAKKYFLEIKDLGLDLDDRKCYVEATLLD